ncbi:hypothetical protein HKBW3S42_02315 [Candidatus Hakubella thermalkaliphila]|uniref:CRISPR-associated protein Cas6 C-terminal domain-containing protein n=1 Tax=Candidatus Hakubella thermalkaliphila TaxID=2754717 RepID=A0A6V8PMX7_9ACTN|nr:hypothetical protein HKBW3S42_02315 [Candidatus Hakubella thermalkaliphila]
MPEQRRDGKWLLPFSLMEFPSQRGIYSLIGFQGKCKYTVLSNQNEMTRYLNILADFAFFAGLGQKTTMGMGQVRRLG